MTVSRCCNFNGFVAWAPTQGAQQVVSYLCYSAQGWMNEKKANGMTTFRTGRREKSLPFETSLSLCKASRTADSTRSRQIALVRSSAESEGKLQARPKVPTLHFPPGSAAQEFGGGPCCRETGGIVPASKIRPLRPLLLSPSQGLSSTLSPGGHQGGENSIHLQSLGRGSCSPRDPRGQRLPCSAKTYPGSPALQLLSYPLLGTVRSGCTCLKSTQAG